MCWKYTAAPSRILSATPIPPTAPGIKAGVFQQALSGQGVCVSVKSACSTDGTPSKAVFAVSRDRKNALSSWRISLSHLTTEEELTGFLAAFDRCLKDLQKEK